MRPSRTQKTELLHPVYTTVTGADPLRQRLAFPYWTVGGSGSPAGLGRDQPEPSPGATHEEPTHSLARWPKWSQEAARARIAAMPRLPWGTERDQGARASVARAPSRATGAGPRSMPRNSAAAARRSRRRHPTPISRMRSNRQESILSGIPRLARARNRGATGKRRQDSDPSTGGFVLHGPSRRRSRSRLVNERPDSRMIRASTVPASKLATPYPHVALRS